MREYALPRTGHILRYHDLPGAGTPILFLHGLGCAGSFDYPEVAAQTPLADHRRILVDLLGAGFSDKPEDFPYTVEAHAEYLAEFVARLGLEHFILFGHSLGGAVAIVLAYKCRNRVKQLILSEANLDPSGEGSTSKQIAGFSQEEFLASGFDELVRDSRASGNGIWAASLAMWLPKGAYLLSRSAARGGAPSWRETLYALPCPKAFLFGARSLPDPDMQKLAEHSVRVDVVPEAGHSMAWENPEGLAETIGEVILAT